MTEPKALKCPSCGAPLDVSPNDSIVECVYCGNDIRVAPDSRGRPRAIPELAYTAYVSYSVNIEQNAEKARQQTRKRTISPQAKPSNKTSNRNAIWILILLGAIVICVSSPQVGNQIVRPTVAAPRALYGGWAGTATARGSSTNLTPNVRTLDNFYATQTALAPTPTVEATVSASQIRQEIVELVEDYLIVYIKPEGAPRVSYRDQGLDIVMGFIATEAQLAEKSYSAAKLLSEFLISAGFDLDAIWYLSDGPDFAMSIEVFSVDGVNRLTMVTDFSLAEDLAAGEVTYEEWLARATIE